MHVGQIVVLDGNEVKVVSIGTGDEEGYVNVIATDDPEAKQFEVCAFELVE